MRKIKRFAVGFLMVVTACLMAVGLSGCTKKGDREKQEIHVCTWEIQSETKATCSSDAKVKMICKDSTCGKTQTVTVPNTKLDHQYEDDDLLTVPATCTEDAYVKEHSCVICGQGKIAQKTLPGTRTYHDGDKNHDDLLDAKDLNTKGEFEFTKKGISREPNCQEQAYCGKCGEFYGDKLNHSPDLVVYKALAATCTLPGHIEYVECHATSEVTGRQCAYTTFEEIKPLGHDGEQGAKKYDEKGNEYLYYDNILSESEIKDIVSGKKVFESATSKLPTCTSAAYCGNCKQYYGEYGHKMVAATCVAPTHCSVEGCDFTVGEALGHLYQTRDAKAQTCEEEGWGEYLYCTRCKYNTQEILPALGHDWKETKALAATCTEVGWEAGVDCSRCHTIKVEPKPIAALGHDGLRAGQSSFSEEYREVEITYIKSTSNVPDCTRKGYCGICKQTYGETSATGQHTMEVIEAKAPTCSEIGWYEYAKCKYCNFSTYKQNVREALDHDWVKYDYKAPTCTEDGHAAQTICKNCQDLVTIPATGHDVDCTLSPDSKKGNCLTKGYCGVCKKSYGTVTGAHVVGTPATCTEKAVCRVCQEEYGNPIGHIVRPNGTCANCGEYIGTQQQAIIKKNKEDAE